MKAGPASLVFCDVHSRLAILVLPNTENGSSHLTRKSSDQRTPKWGTYASIINTVNGGRDRTMAVLAGRQKLL
jgi:hypothetical protein